MKLVPASVAMRFAKQALVLRKNSPTLLFGAGVVGMTTSTVLACRSTLRLEEVIAKTQNNLNQAKAVAQTMPDDYPESDLRRDTAVIYARGARDLVRLYGPAVLLGLASVAALTKSHNILQERNLALTAAYAAVDEAFKNYRSKVVDKYGEDEDRQLMHETERVRVMDDDTGKQVTKTRVNSDGTPSMYARFFDELSSEWQKEPEYNFTFVRQQQNWFNDILQVRGYVFLNDVYKRLGIAPSKAGQVVGWFLDGNGDSYVDFGIFDPHNEKAVDFVNGREGSILLDFNVDGVIYDKLDRMGEVEDHKPWQS